MAGATGMTEMVAPVERRKPPLPTGRVPLQPCGDLRHCGSAALKNMKIVGEAREVVNKLNTPNPLWCGLR